MANTVDISNVTTEQRAQILREERDLIAVAHFNAEAGMGNPNPKRFEQIMDFMNDRIRSLAGGNTYIGDSVGRD